MPNFNALLDKYKNKKRGTTSSSSLSEAAAPGSETGKRKREEDEPKSHENILFPAPEKSITALTNKYVDPTTTSRGEMATIGRRCRTDKVTHHGYHRFYPRFLEHMRSVEVSGGGAMLEIGIDRTFSLSMWLEYFSHAHIYGLDIGVEDSGDRHTIFKGGYIH